MPELPEVETIRKGLKKSILGKKIKKVNVRLPKIISIGPGTVSNIRSASKKTVMEFKGVIQGQEFVSVKRRSKLLIMDLSGPWTLLVHLKMTGQFIFAYKKELPKKAKIYNKPDGKRLKMPHKYTHVVFHFEDDSKLYYNDMRQFGHMRLVADSELEEVREFADYGPEPLAPHPLNSKGEGFTLEYFKAKARSRSISVKQFLVDPKVVAGIGNIYSDEILFCAKVKPQKKARGLSNKELEKIYKCIPKILKKAVKRQGSSVGDFFKVDGSEGKFGEDHQVYGLSGEKCRKCGKMIESVKLGGRTSSYCPSCQK